MSLLPHLCTLTWTVKGVPGPIIVVSLIKSQPDVCKTRTGLPEHQAGHVAPQLEGGAHPQLHRAQRQVARPVDYLVGQVVLGPLPVWGNIEGEYGKEAEKAGALQQPLGQLRR